MWDSYLEAHFTLEGLHARVYVRVLLESRRRGERFPALGARMGASTHVVGPNVPLEVAGVCESLQTFTMTTSPGWLRPHLWTVLAVVFPVLAVHHRAVLDEAGPVRVGLGAEVAGVLVPAVVMLDHEVVVEPGKTTVVGRVMVDGHARCR